ncbi:MAG: Hsp20/alpha crystallin family protein, partial [Betaproteobacteria bacterium]
MNGLPARRDAFSAFDDFFSDFFNRAGLPVAARAAELPSAVRARMDVIDKGEKYEVLVDLPGVKKEDIVIDIEGARVSISANVVTETPVKEGEKLLYTERVAR